MLKPHSNTSYIYTLADPRDNAVRYVGVSINPRKRVTSIMGGFHSGAAVQKWAAELKALSLRPQLEIIDECITATRNAKEYYWITIYHREGHDLLNVDGISRKYGMGHRWKNDN